MRRLSSRLSPRRQVFVGGLVGLVLVAVVVAVVLRIGGSSSAVSGEVARQDQPGTVLLVPGYGGSTASVGALADAVRAQGREAVVVALPGGGVGPLEEQADALDGYVQQALEDGSPSVDLVGYSAGGVVVRLWVQRNDDAGTAAADVRRVVTLGAPHHGTSLAALGAALGGSSCPAACLELAPGSTLLSDLVTPVPTPPAWLALWTTQDQTVTPPNSGALEGAVSTSVQAVCPGLVVGHGQLPTDPVVTAFVLAALGTAPLASPDPALCA